MWEWLFGLWQRMLRVLRRWLRAAVLSSPLVSPSRRSAEIPVNCLSTSDCGTGVHEQIKKLTVAWKSLSSLLLILSLVLLSSHWKLCATGFLMERLWIQAQTHVRGRDGLPAWCLSAFGVIPSSPSIMLLDGSMWNAIKPDQCKGFVHPSSPSPGLFPDCPSMHTSCAAHGWKIHRMTHTCICRPYSSPWWTPKCPKACEVYKNSASKLSLQLSEYFLANEIQSFSKKYMAYLIFTDSRKSLMKASRLSSHCKQLQESLII